MSAVAVQGVAVDAGDVEVGPTVVVEVARRDPHRVPLAVEARLFGDVAEGVVALVAVEPVPKAGIVLLKPGDPGAVGEEDVEQAVIVEIEHRDAAEHRVDDRLVGCGAVFEDEPDSGCRLPVLEPNVTRRRCFFGFGRWIRLNEPGRPERSHHQADADTNGGWRRSTVHTAGREGERPDHDLVLEHIGNRMNLPIRPRLPCTGIRSNRPAEAGMLFECHLLQSCILN
jgi:hypothetical protein